MTTILRLPISFAITGALISLMAVACADYGAPPTSPLNTPPVISFAGEVRDTFVVRCAKSGCHGPGSSQGGFTMGNVTWSEITNGFGNHGAVLVPGDALASNIFLKTTASPPFGFRMPNDGPPFLSL